MEEAPAGLWEESHDMTHVEKNKHLKIKKGSGEMAPWVLLC